MIPDHAPNHARDQDLPGSYCISSKVYSHTTVYQEVASSIGILSW